MKLVKKYKLIIIVLLLAIPTIYGMDNKKRERDESSEQAIVPAKRIRNNEIYSEELSDNELLQIEAQIIKEKIQQIHKAIEKNSPELVETLLATGLITDEKQLQQLYRHAELNEAQKSPQQKDSLDSQYEELTQEQKKDYQRAKKIIVILGAFYHLKDLTFPKALFTPRPYSNSIPTIDLALEYLISNEKEKISICCFHFTLFNIARALVKQNKKDIIIEIITDQKQGENKTTLEALEYIVNNGIQVLAPKNHKWDTDHHKFIIFHKNIDNNVLLWNGSYNLTGHANKEWNDVIIENHANIINAYKSRFEEIKQASTSIKNEILEHVKTNKPTPYSYKINKVYPSVLKKK